MIIFQQFRNQFVEQKLPALLLLVFCAFLIETKQCYLTTVTVSHVDASTCTLAFEVDGIDEEQLDPTPPVTLILNEPFYILTRIVFAAAYRDVVPFFRYVFPPPRAPPFF